MAATYQQVYVGQNAGVVATTITGVAISAGQGLALCYISRVGLETGWTSRTHNGVSLGSPNYSGTPVLATGQYTFAEVFHSPAAATGDIVVTLDASPNEATVYAVVFNNPNTTTAALDFDAVDHDYSPANQESLSSTSSSDALLLTWARARADLSASMVASTMTVRSAATVTGAGATVMLASKAGTGNPDTTQIEFDGSAFPTVMMATLAINGASGSSQAPRSSAFMRMLMNN